MLKPSIKLEITNPLVLQSYMDKGWETDNVFGVKLYLEIYTGEDDLISIVKTISFEKVECSGFDILSYEFVNAVIALMEFKHDTFQTTSLEKV